MTLYTLSENSIVIISWSSERLTMNVYSGSIEHDLVARMTVIQFSFLSLQKSVVHSCSPLNAKLCWLNVDRFVSLVGKSGKTMCVGYFLCSLVKLSQKFKIKTYKNHQIFNYTFTFGCDRSNSSFQKFQSLKCSINEIF